MFAGRNAEAYCLSPSPVTTAPVACRASLPVSTKAQATQPAAPFVVTTLSAATGPLLPQPVATVLQLKGRLDTFRDTSFFACEADMLVYDSVIPQTSVYIRSHFDNAGQINPEHQSRIVYWAPVTCHSPCTTATQQPDQGMIFGEPAIQILCMLNVLFAWHACKRRFGVSIALVKQMLVIDITIKFPVVWGAT